MDKLISVIVPVYKVEKYLERCVESIRNQTYSNIEIILVDDGSPDSCPTVCDRYAEKDGRIRVIHKENGGLSDARNVGIDAACGEYIGFVDSDDYIHSEMYENLVRSIKKTGAEIAVCGVRKVYDTDPEEQPVRDQDKVKVCSGIQAVKNIFEPDLYLQSVVAWNKLYRKELFDNVRYPVGKLHEDEFTTYKLLNKCKKVVYIEEKYYYYYQRTDSIMGRKAVHFTNDNLEAYEEMAEFFLQLGNPDVAQLAKYRYLCLLKKYAVQFFSRTDDHLSRELFRRYAEEYKRSIRTIKKFRRRFRLWAFRWFRVSF